MNRKYLFGMLVSGAMLAACTADDLDTAPVAQEANPSAPVFTVGLDDGEGNLQNRAYFVAGSSNKIIFEGGDKMSLFHGISAEDPTTDLSGWQNAVYVAEDGTDSGNGFTFTTRAMVQPGYAIMVYPADLGFSQMSTGNVGAHAPYVRISAKQDSLASDSIPYISDVIELKKDGTATEQNEAGYDKKYDLFLKKAAGTLRLALGKKNNPTFDEEDDIEPLTITSVTLDLGESATKKFSLELPVIATKKIESGDQAKRDQKHKTWKYATSLDTVYHSDKNLAVSSTLESEHIIYSGAKGTGKAAGEVIDTVQFVVLPFTNGSGAVSELKVIVNTNYGTVTVDAMTEKVLGADRDKTFSDLAAGIFYNLWHPAEAGSTFEGDKIGGHLRIGMTVDMSKLVMTNTHVKNEKDLETILKVYKKLNPAGVTNLYLDGDENGVFEITDMALLDDVVKYMADSQVQTATKKLTFTPCKDYTGHVACTTIKLKNDGTAKEIPSLNFETNTVKVQLAGNWEYKKVTDVSTANTNNAKNMGNVSGLTLLAGGNLALENNIAVKENQLTDGITIENTANVTVSKMKTDVYVTLKNNGTITINAGGELRASTGGTIENCADPQVTAANATKLTGLTASKYGKIYNSGILGVDQTTDGVVNNYGLIDIKTATAATLVTTNAKSDASVRNDYGDNDNYFGTILLDKADETMTKVEGKKGFIKKTITTERPSVEAIGTLANYLILDAECTNVSAADLPANDWTNGVQYIEIKKPESGQHNVKFDGTENNIILQGLIVPENCVVNIGRGTTVQMGANGSTIYLKGTIVNAGNLTSNKNTPNTLPANDAIFKGYFGEGSKDITTVNQ